MFALKQVLGFFFCFFTFYAMEMLSENENLKMKERGNWTERNLLRFSFFRSQHNSNDQFTENLFDSSKCCTNCAYYKVLF